MLPPSPFGFGETSRVHAFGIRRTRPQHEAFGGVGRIAASGSLCCFHELAARPAGQSLRRRLAVAFRGRTDEAHRAEDRGGVGHEHRKATQQRIDPAIKRRRAYQASVRGFVPCHGHECLTEKPTHRSRTRRFCILWILLGNRRVETLEPVRRFALATTSWGFRRFGEAAYSRPNPYRNARPKKKMPPLAMRQARPSARRRLPPVGLLLKKGWKAMLILKNS